MKFLVRVDVLFFTTGSKILGPSSTDSHGQDSGSWCLREVFISFGFGTLSQISSLLLDLSGGTAEKRGTVNKQKQFKSPKASTKHGIW